MVLPILEAENWEFDLGTGSKQLNGAQPSLFDAVWLANHQSLEPARNTSIISPSRKDISDGLLV